MGAKFDSVKVIESRTVYDKLGRRIVEDVLEFTDGSKHEWVYFKGTGAKTGAVAVAAFTEDNRMILTKQYRHPFRKTIQDIPAGGIEGDETPEQAALRKLKEETAILPRSLSGLEDSARLPEPWEGPWRYSLRNRSNQRATLIQTR